MKILMVCLGNICRSPLAEGILKSKLPQDLFTIDSAGTSNYHQGNPPDIRSINIARAHNINIVNQRARQFKVEDFDVYDLIYAMDSSNYKNITRLARTASDKSRVKLILNEITEFKLKDVPDPYYDQENGFLNVYKMLNIACDNIAKKIHNDSF